MNVTPYLFFEGRTEEAIEFYKKAVGAKTQSFLRYSDGPPDACPAPMPKEKVMHASFRIGETVILASDGRCSGKTNFQGVALSLYAADDAEAKKLFTALSEGGQVQMPIGKTFFASSFGMLADQFGVMWMILAGAATH